MNIVIAIVLLGILVAVHEFGHFIVAKISGMYVEKFSIGVGPKIASFQKGETEYVFSVIPAGGFVSVRGITGEDDEHADRDDPRLFQNRPILHRMLFVVAGPFMNFAFAVALLMTAYMALGMEVPDPASPPVIDSVNEGAPADTAGLQAGDTIVSINGQTMDKWTDVDEFMSAYSGGTLQMDYVRDGKEIETTLDPSYSQELDRYALGVTKQVVTHHQDVDLQGAYHQSMAVSLRMSTMILDAVGDLVTRKTAVNDEEGGLSGPVGIVHVIGQTVNQGIWNVITLMAIFSINFALLNMLPVPALDGSRLLFLIIEEIRGMAVDPNKEMLVNLAGLLALMVLMLYVTYNDILRLVN
jgi:regulator of sigma E protease